MEARQQEGESSGERGRGRGGRGSGRGRGGRGRGGREPTSDRDMENWRPREVSDQTASPKNYPRSPQGSRGPPRVHNPEDSQSTESRGRGRRKVFRPAPSQTEGQEKPQPPYPASQRRKRPINKTKEFGQERTEKQGGLPGTPKKQRQPAQPTTPQTPKFAGTPKKARVRKPVFEEYWSQEAVAAGLADGTLKEAVLRVNPFNRLESYCTVEGMTVDILIEGRNQNRAFDGDTVVVQIFPQDKWTYLKDVDVIEDVIVNEDYEEEDEEFEEEVLLEIEALEEEEVEKKLLEEEMKLADKVAEADYDQEGDEEADSDVDDDEESEDDGAEYDGEEDDEEEAETEKKEESDPTTSTTITVESPKPPSKTQETPKKTPLKGTETPKTPSTPKQTPLKGTETPKTPSTPKQTPLKGTETPKTPSTPQKQHTGTSTPSVMSPNSKGRRTSGGKDAERPKDRPTGKIVAITEAAHKTKNFVGFLKPLETGGAKKKNQKSDPKSPQTPKKTPLSVYFVPADRKLTKFLIKASQCAPDFYEDPEKHGNTFWVANFTSWPSTFVFPNARLLKSIGTAGEILSETEALLQTHSVDTSDFHPRLISGIPDKFVLTDAELRTRKDFRSTRIFTIDPATARDLDDALHVTPLPNGNFEVGVHIADVSYYIQPGTELDIVAKSRATSVYLVHRVIPMLPRLLCENLCSLNPGVDRLAFSVVWELTPEGEIKRQWFGRSVINSAGKLAYGHAQKVIENFEEGVTEIAAVASPGHNPRDIATDITYLHSMAAKMRARRYENGALSLGKQKLYFDIDENYNPTGFHIYVQKESNFLIEEFMLLANMSVAKFIYEKFPENSLLRHHPAPNDRKLKEFLKFCEAIGIEMDCESSGVFHDCLQQIPEKYPHLNGIKQIVEDLATRPMQMALYFCTGDIDEERFHHYALNVPFYTHFTSPIRRYADVCVHRLLQAALTSSSAGLWSKSAISQISKDCNTKKTNARKAQQDGDKLYLAVYLKDHPLTDDACIVSELGRNYVFCYSPALGLVVRVFLDGYDVIYDPKDNKSIVTLKKPKKKEERGLIGGEEKGKRQRQGKKQDEVKKEEEAKEEETQDGQEGEEEDAPPFTVVLKPLSTIKVLFTMSPGRPIDIKGFLVPEHSTKNTFNIV